MKFVDLLVIVLVCCLVDDTLLLYTQSLKGEHLANQNCCEVNCQNQGLVSAPDFYGEGNRLNFKLEYYCIKHFEEQREKMKRIYTLLGCHFCNKPDLTMCYACSNIYSLAWRTDKYFCHGYCSGVVDNYSPPCMCFIFVFFFPSAFLILQVNI